MDDIKECPPSNTSNNPESRSTKFLTYKIHSCKTPFEELKAITLRDLDVSIVYRGGYLVCKVIRMPDPGDANFLIQDLNGDYEQCVIYIFCLELDDIDCISAGTILIVKEPLKQQHCHPKKKSFYLKINSPSDVIFVDPTDYEFLNKIGAKKWYKSMSKDAEFWRKEANEYFKTGKYGNALKLYDRALRYNPEISVLYLNKSLTCLKVGAYYEAYKCAKIALDKDGGDREKALYRLAQAAYGMREWQKSLQHSIELLKEFPLNKAAAEHLKRAATRLSEQKHGKFDFKKMFLKSKSDKIEMDVADFTGPIEIANIPGKGRGIIASEDIKAGTLLIVSKAFASGYSQDFLGPMNSATAKNVAQTLLINKAMKNLQKNPHRAKEVYDLYAGDDDMEKEEIPEGIIDAVRIIQIVEFNAFGFDGEANIEANLYILPSFFNHACPENACRTFYGDVMEVHAVVDVQKGKEICLSYISKPYLLDYSVRKEKFHDWNFTCNCRLCETDSKDEFSSKRAQMFAEFKEYAQANSKNHELVIAKGEKFLQQIRESYAKRNDFKIVLVELLKLLYRYYKAVKNGKECFKCWEEVVELVNKSCRYDIDLACMTYDLAHFLYKSNIAEKDGLVKKALEMSFCSDLEHFKMLNNV